MIILKGLQVEKFTHPQDKASWTVISKAPWLMKLMDWVMTKEAQYEIATDYLGNAIEVTSEMLPRLFQMNREVCTVLDYEPVPRIFTRRSSFLGGFINAGENPILIFPDFVLNTFDEGMLRFQLGRMITALKTKNAPIRTSVNWILNQTDKEPIASLIVKPLLADWVRKSRYTEDRSALLACQYELVAMKTLFRFAGLPLKYIDPSIFPEYIAEYQKTKGLASISQSAMTAYRTEAWPNDRIVELYKWYSSGENYDLLEEYELVREE